MEYHKKLLIIVGADWHLEIETHAFWSVIYTVICMMCLHDRFYNGKPESTPGRVTVMGSINLVESFPDSYKVLFGKGRAVVLYIYLVPAF